MRIAVDWALCDGNGICALEAPEYFELDDDDELQLLQEQVGDGDRDVVERAVVGCPKHALTVVD